MRVKEMLAAVKSEVEGIAPAVGQVYQTLLAKFDPRDIATTTHFLDPRISADKKVVKFFIVFPGEGEAAPHTVGRSGFILHQQEIVVTGFVGVHQDGGPELVLLDDFDAIINRLAGVGRLKDGAGKETEVANLANFRHTGLARVSVGETLCHFKELRFTLQERRLRN